MATQILLLIHYVDLLSAIQDGSIILPATQHMNYHLAAGISFQLAYQCELAGFKPPNNIL